MTGDNLLTTLAVLIIGYLFGSLPSAYIVTRLVTGKDIRQLGGGNVGGLNTVREVGLVPGIVVTAADLSKGAAAIAVVYWLLGLQDVTQPWVLLAGLSAVLGHNWMVWLKFSGGKGMGPAVGIITMAMPLYGYWPGVLIFLGIVAIPFFITHNVALSAGIGLLATPFIAWLGIKSGLFVAWSVVTGVIIGLKFLPTGMAAWAKARNKRDFIFDRPRRKS